MGQIKNGTVTVTNGSPLVTANLPTTSMDWSTVGTGGIPYYFGVSGQGVLYQVAAPAFIVQISGQNYWRFALTAPYAGTTNPNAGYFIVRDWTPNYSLPLMSPGDSNSPTIFSKLATLVDSLLRSEQSPQVIADQTLSADGTSFTSITVPQTFTHLEFFILSRNSGGTAADALFRFNGDATAANYTTEYIQGITTTVTSALQSDTAGLKLAISNGTDGPAGSAGVSIGRIMLYRSTSFWKYARSNQTWYNGSPAGHTHRTSFGYWKNSVDAINTLQVVAASGNFKSGSRLILYGIK